MAEAPRVMLARLRLQVSPVAGDTLAARLTVPVNPLTLVTVIVDVPVAPEATVTPVGLALIVKSLTVKVTVDVLEREPLVPVTVTV